MKIQNIIFIFLLACIYWACTPEETTQPNKELISRLWRISYINQIQDTSAYCSDYFIYDSKGRISKIWPCLKELSDTTTSDAFYLFSYNENNQIETKLGYMYYGNGLGWYVNDSTYYYYENKLLVKEEIWHPKLQVSPQIIYYEYENDHLIRQSSLASEYKWILFEYEDSLCVKELRCTDRVGEKISYYIHHIYYNGLKIRSELYSFNSNTLGQVINFTYNRTRQLVLEESIVNPEWVAPGNYVYRYEYEKVPE